MNQFATELNSVLKMKRALGWFTSLYAIFTMFASFLVKIKAVIDSESKLNNFVYFLFPVQQ
jgi:hypothetical protein